MKYEDIENLYDLYKKTRCERQTESLLKILDEKPNEVGNVPIYYGDGDICCVVSDNIGDGIPSKDVANYLVIAYNLAGKIARELLELKNRIVKKSYVLNQIKIKYPEIYEEYKDDL